MASGTLSCVHGSVSPTAEGVGKTEEEERGTPAAHLKGERGRCDQTKKAFYWRECKLFMEKGPRLPGILEKGGSLAMRCA